MWTPPSISSNTWRRHALINQAKTQLWQIVSECIGAKQNGKTPEVYVTHYQYGNDGRGAREHPARCVQPSRRILGGIADGLFALRTDGGDEFGGAVIKTVREQAATRRSPGGSSRWWPGADTAGAPAIDTVESGSYYWGAAVPLSILDAV